MPKPLINTGGRISVGISAELLERLERIAPAIRLARSDFIRRALETELDRVEARRPREHSAATP